ncbi:MAG: tandem-95 repeat protein [Novosphingobium sp.]
MSNSVVPAAAAAQAKHLVRNKKLTKQTEDQKPVHNEHDEQAPSDDHEPDAANAVQTEEAEKQTSSMSDVSLSGDFTFAGALAEAAEGTASLTSEASADDGDYGSDDDGGAGGTILLVGALGLVGAGIAVLADGGGKSNEPPTADDSQAVATDEDTPVAVTVVATDPDGDALTYTVTGNPSNGAVSGGTGGVFTYTPATDYFGNDSFVVTATDPDGATVTQTVNVTIAPVNDAPKPTGDLTGTTAEDTPLDVVLDFEDPEGDDFTGVLTTGPTNGTYDVDTSIYTPNADFFGEDSITFTATDENGASADYTFVITVTPVNDDPVADASQDVSTTVDDPLDITVTATDVDGDDLSYSVTTDPTSGMVAAGANAGEFTYTPDMDFTGDDSFVVTVDDGNGGTVTQTVNITVTPDSISLDIGVPASPNPEVLDASGADFLYTDDATLNTHVLLQGFTEGDFIQVSNAQEADYSFGTSASDAKDIVVGYSPDGIIQNIIIIDDVLDGGFNFLETYQDAADLVGYDFMSFG